MTASRTPSFVAGVAAFVKSGPAGISVSASEAAPDTAPYTYQWQRSVDNVVWDDLRDGPSMSGATTRELRDGSAVVDVLYGYRLRYTDRAGRVEVSNLVTAMLYLGGPLGVGDALA